MKSPFAFLARSATAKQIYLLAPEEVENPRQAVTKQYKIKRRKAQRLERARQRYARLHA